MNTPFPYAIKFQRRKTLALHVLADGAVEVRAPNRVSQREIAAFVAARAEWVLKTRAQQLHRQRWQVPAAPGAGVWFLGETHTLEVEGGTAFSVQREAQRLLVRCRNPADPALLARGLDDWYREQALAVFSARLAQVCAGFPGAPALPQLRLRRMRRRWGSCSRSGLVTLNTELIKLPVELIDYVIAHELCHLYEFNHSPRFYRLLSAAVPEWKTREALLKQF